MTDSVVPDGVPRGAEPLRTNLHDLAEQTHPPLIGRRLNIVTPLDTVETVRELVDDAAEVTVLVHDIAAADVIRC